MSKDDERRKNDMVSARRFFYEHHATRSDDIGFSEDGWRVWRERAKRRVYDESRVARPRRGVDEGADTLTNETFVGVEYYYTSIY